MSSVSSLTASYRLLKSFELIEEAIRGTRSIAGDSAHPFPTSTRLAMLLRCELDDELLSTSSPSSCKSTVAFPTVRLALFSSPCAAPARVDLLPRGGLPSLLSSPTTRSLVDRIVLRREEGVTANVLFIAFSCASTFSTTRTSASAHRRSSRSNSPVALLSMWISSIARFPACRGSALPSLRNCTTTGNRRSRSLELSSFGPMLSTRAQR
mmetsp:Transcript_6261/g.22252  ORF Transcript_6261/g.22252 Transcript_6261/m.22252 type:complete len:210 (-) Transcript_6261:3614-4243(-)